MTISHLVTLDPGGRSIGSVVCGAAEELGAAIVVMAPHGQSPYTMLGCRFGIRTDSVDSRIRTDSDGFQDPKYGSRQPRHHVIVAATVYRYTTGNPLY
jgi:hypothetical protein